jgi:hypothetical protein
MSSLMFWRTDWTQACVDDTGNSLHTFPVPNQVSQLTSHLRSSHPHIVHADVDVSLKDFPPASSEAVLPFLLLPPSPVFIFSFLFFILDDMDGKKIYVKNSNKVDSCLKHVKVETMPDDELRRIVLELAHRLVTDGLLDYPVQVWSNYHDGDESENKDPSPEKKIISRFGFLMTNVLVFIRPGTSGQLSAGAMSPFFFLLLGLFWRPFYSSILNNLNSGTLITQFLTLFVGIMKERLDVMSAETGGEDESLDRVIMSFMVVTVNGVTLE